jgi:glutamate--cysteine ligase
VEYETPAVNAATGEALPYEGLRPSIRDILEDMAADTRWAPVYEDDRVIALRDESASITLEPGGQVELSGKQCESMHDAHDEFVEHVERLVSLSTRLGVAFLGWARLLNPRRSARGCLRSYRIMQRS